MNNKPAGWILLLAGIAGGLMNMWALSLGDFDTVLFAVMVICFSGAAYGVHLLRKG